MQRKPWSTGLAARWRGFRGFFRSEEMPVKRGSPLRNGIAAALIALAPALGAGVTIHVPDDQPTIQEGLDAASVGDTVLVECGASGTSPTTWGRMKADFR